MQNYNTIVMREDQFEFATEKKCRVQSGFLDIATPKKPPQLNYDEPPTDQNIFLNMKYIDKYYADLPDVFQLNKPNENELMNVPIHIQPHSGCFDLNFKIPRLTEQDRINWFTESTIETSRPATAISQVQEVKNEEPINHYFDINLRREQITYWEHLCMIQFQSIASRVPPMLVEVNPINIGNIFSVDASIKVENQFDYARNPTTNTISNLIFQINRDFKMNNQRYEQAKICYVEDMTALKQINQFFMDIATFLQNLRLFVMKPPMNKISQRIKQIIQEILDETQNTILLMEILEPQITLLNLFSRSQLLYDQLRTIHRIFYEDPNPLEKLYKYIENIKTKDLCLKHYFISLTNNLLQDLQRGLFQQDTDIQIPSFFPHNFQSHYNTVIKNITLIDQGKELKYQFIDTMLDMCQLRHFKLLLNCLEKSNYIKKYYEMKEQQIERLHQQLLKFREEQMKSEKIKKLEEVRKIKEKLKRQKEREEQLKQEGTKEEDRELEQVNRIIRTYDKLIRQQDERNLQLEDELREKQKLQKEKIKLLNDLALIEGKPLQEEHSESISLFQETEQQKQKKFELMYGMEVEYFREDNQSISSIRSKIEKILNNKKRGDGELEPPNEDYQSDDHFQTIINISVGMHMKHHYDLTNKLVKFVLFQELGFLKFWENIRKHYFTMDGDYLESFLFQYIDGFGCILPSILRGFETNPKIYVKSHLAHSPQDFLQSNFADILYIQLDSRSNLLQACFTPSVTTRVLVFFDLIIKIRFMSYQLRKKWKQIPRVIKQQQLQKNFCLLRNQMQKFVDSYLNFIFYDILETTWQEFINALNLCLTLEQIVATELTYLDKLLETSLIKTDKKNIKESLWKCLHMINKFCMIIDMEQNRGLIEEVDLDISELTQNFSLQSSYFSKFI
ncbi:hypothetical protein pb186bvf_014789 [Paramecium bursaria]